MSGTSTDALDLCWVEFIHTPVLRSNLIHFESVAYSDTWKRIIESAHLLNGLELLTLHRAYALWVAEQVQALGKHIEKPLTAVGFHGPTLFHRPDLKLSFQLGSPEALSRALGVCVVADFRSSDLELGGRGAPLVPFGDQLLYREYDVCINLGGFANHSEQILGQRVASDLCACNYLLDRIARTKGLAYDDRGRLAASGTLMTDWVEELDAHSALEGNHPIALSRELFDSEIAGWLKKAAPEDLLRSFCEHIAHMCARRIQSRGRILITGGGAYNDFLIERIRAALSPARIEIPDKTTIESKEALVFALLAYMKIRGEKNVIASSTGAYRDHTAGTLYDAIDPNFLG